MYRVKQHIEVPDKLYILDGEKLLAIIPRAQNEEQQKLAQKIAALPELLDALEFFTKNLPDCAEGSGACLVDNDDCFSSPLCGPWLPCKWKDMVRQLRKVLEG